MLHDYNYQVKDVNVLGGSICRRRLHSLRHVADELYRKLLKVMDIFGWRLAYLHDLGKY